MEESVVQTSKEKKKFPNHMEDSKLTLLEKTESVILVIMQNSNTYIYPSVSEGRVSFWLMNEFKVPTVIKMGL